MNEISFLAKIEFWHWWIAAIALVGFEMMVPGTYLVWLGAAAGIVGLAMVVAPGLDWQIQFAIFAVLSVASVVGARAWIKAHPQESDQPALNLRGRQYIGRTYTLVEPIENGSGRLKVDDTIWRVRGEDAPAGTKVRVTGIDGTVLEVEGT